MEYDPLLTMTALNLAIVSLHRITATGDRVTLDQEYTGIINNLRMGEINADPELTKLYQEIVHAICRGMLRNDSRASLSIGPRHRDIKDIIAKNVLTSFHFNPFEWLGMLARSCASEYFYTLRQEEELTQYQQDEAIRLNREELEEYYELQQKLLVASWKLLRRYNLPDKYRLTQIGLNRFYQAMRESVPSKRLRMLRYLAGDFEMYSPYWFHRASAAYETGINDEDAAESIEKFGRAWRPVLRKDPYKAEILKYRIDELVRSGITDKNAVEILDCLSEMRANIPLEDWANNIYIGTVYFTLGMKSKAEECVMCNIDFGFETEASKELLDRFMNNTPPSRFDLLKQAAEQGHPEAQNELGYMYSRGEGTNLNYGEAIKWFRMAAEQGYSVAQYNLGIMYHNGKGIAQNYSEALKWYCRAAEQDYAIAQNNLGYMYYNGEGVRQDYGEAVKWFRRAAEQGYAIAQNNLGYMFKYGLGVKQDQYEAENWFNRQNENSSRKTLEGISIAVAGTHRNTKEA